MLKGYKIILWDWNGTILNDVDLCVGISNEVLRKSGLKELDVQHYKDVFGFPITAYYERIGIDLRKVSMESLTKQFIASYMASVRECNLQNEVEKVLTHLKAVEKKQYILTAAHTEIAEELLNHYNIRNYFLAVAGLDNHRAESKVSRGKELIKQHGIAPKEAVLIGDTLHDFEVAEALGVHCILIAKGHQSKTRLERGVNGKAIVLASVGLLIK